MISMIRLTDSIAGDKIHFYYAETARDVRKIMVILRSRRVWAMDTESTGLDTFHPDWQLRLFQFGDSTRSFVIPARFKRAIYAVTQMDIRWIAHNGPHDVRSLDAFIGRETGMVCVGETHIPSHHRDSRNRQEGGTGHGLKDLAEALVDPHAGKWERALNVEFKKIQVPVEGAVYKSGPRKGMQRMRTIRLSEGWALIDPTNRAYIAYAAADPILTFRVWRYLKSQILGNPELYDFDMRVQAACDRLTRRAMLVDVPYTQQLHRAYERHAKRMTARAAEYGCRNINSGAQLASTLASLGVELTRMTKTNQLCTDSNVLRPLLTHDDPHVRRFIGAVLAAKQVQKRHDSYTGHFLSQRDSNDRIHPSINTLAARTARMSVSNPALQQLPTKDRESEV